jgi:testis-expressed sequence 13 family protein
MLERERPSGRLGPRKFAMTEQEWFTHNDPAPMLEFVASRASERSLRLFLCACCARTWEAAGRRGSETSAGRRHGSMRMIRTALTLVERFADGLRGREALQSARQLTEEAEDIPASIDYGAESGVDGVAEAVRAATGRRLTPENAVAAWICPGCNAHNFARRQSCHQCKGAWPS